MNRKIIPAAIAVLLLASLAGGCTTANNTASEPPAATAASGADTSASWSDDETAIKKYQDAMKSVPQEDFTLPDLSGKQWKLSDLKGKVVLLNFWATWCSPCLMEMPEFQKLYERFGEDGEVIVLAVAGTALEGGTADAAKAAVTALVEDQGFTFPVLFDADGSVWQAYQQQGIPANYIIDKQGNVRLLKSGAFTGEKELYAVLEAVRRADSGK